MVNLKFVFGCFTFLGLIIYSCQKLAFKLPKVVNNYFNDFLILPIVLLLSLFVVRKLKGDELLILPWSLVLFLSGFYAWFFEFFLPQYNLRYTADCIDVLLYFFGGFLFLFLQLHEKK